MKNSLKGHEVKAPVITLGNTQLRDNVATLVRQRVEEILNALLDAEADIFWKVQKYECNDERAGAWEWLNGDNRGTSHGKC